MVSAEHLISTNSQRRLSRNGRGADGVRPSKGMPDMGGLLEAASTIVGAGVGGAMGSAAQAYVADRLRRARSPKPTIILPPGVDRRVEDRDYPRGRRLGGGGTSVHADPWRPPRQG